MCECVHVCVCVLGWGGVRGEGGGGSSSANECIFCYVKEKSIILHLYAVLVSSWWSLWQALEFGHQLQNNHI